MTCEKCKMNRMDVKDWTFAPYGTYSVCIPCQRQVTDWLQDLERNIVKSLRVFVLGETSRELD